MVTEQDEETSSHYPDGSTRVQHREVGTEAVGEREEADSGLNDVKGIWLLILTLILELPGVLVRWFLLTLISSPLYFYVLFTRLDSLNLQTTGQLQRSWVETTLLPFVQTLNIALALAPLLFAVATLVFLPGGFTLTRFALGARDPSLRERQSVLQALERIKHTTKARSKKVRRTPTKWFVVDDPSQENAFVVGTTLYITRPLINSPHLTSVLAHEYGHINSLDGRLTLALRRLVVPPVYAFANLANVLAPGTLVVVAAGNPLALYMQLFWFWLTSAFLSLAGGGFGLWLLNPFWVWYWRWREYEADRYAAECGFAQELIAYLEQHQIFDTAVPYFMSHHPYTELRIDRLLAYEREHTP